MKNALISRLVVLALLVVGSFALAACGDDGTIQADTEEQATTQSSEESGTTGNGIDRSFVTEMVPHHRSAVDMAEIAKERAERPEIKQLADDIIRTQQAEIETLEDFGRQLDEAGVKAEDLGVAQEHMGMSGDSAMLQNADPFDREFIDMMIPHHQGAIRMARAELGKGADPDVKKLAQDIIDAQAREIEQMNTWREDWYGEASPAGGVPQEDETSASPEQSGEHPAGHGG